MISRCWRHWSNILEMEVRGLFALVAGNRRMGGWTECRGGQSEAALSDVLRALEHECGVW